MGPTLFLLFPYEWKILWRKNSLSNFYEELNEQKSIYFSFFISLTECFFHSFIHFSIQFNSYQLKPLFSTCFLHKSLSIISVSKSKLQIIKFWEEYLFYFLTSIASNFFFSISAFIQLVAVDFSTFFTDISESCFWASCKAFRAASC